MLKGSEKLLLIKPSSLGDIVHSLAFLNSLKENFPSLIVHWVVASGFEELLTDHPMVEKVFVINKDKWKAIQNLRETIREFSNLSAQLKNENYEIAVDLQGLLRSGIITALSGATFRYGFKEGRELSTLFYNRIVSASVNMHAIMRYLEMAKALGCQIKSIQFPLPPEKQPEWLKDFNDYVVIIPSARWQTKNWPIPYFVELIKMLHYNFLIIGSKKDEADALNIEKYSQGKAKSVAGKTSLRELIAVFKKSLFVITPDTGTMHLAVACGKKVVALFGPTSSARTGPFGEGHLIIKSSLSCSPCFKKSCPDLKCMKEITPEMVYNRIIQWRQHEISKR